MSTPENPYTPHSHALPPIFYGRGAELSRVQTMLTHGLGMSVLLFGGRRIGKTSLLYRLRQGLIDASNAPAARRLLIPVMWRLLNLRQTVAGPAAFFRKLADQIVVAAREAYGLDLSFDTARFHHEPQVSEVFAELLREWSAAVAAQDGRDMRIIGLFDEAEQIVYVDWAASGANLLRNLQDDMALGPMFRFVMAGPPAFLDRIKQIDSPLENICEQVFLERLDPEAARALIMEPTGGALAETVCRHLIAKVGGQPFLIQYVMYHLVQGGIAGATDETIDGIGEHFLDERRDFAGWSEALGEQARAVYRLLAEAPGPLTPEQIRAGAPRLFESRSGFVGALNALCAHGIVEQTTPRRYAPSGSMFRDWMLAQRPALVAQGATPPRGSPIPLLTIAVRRDTPTSGTHFTLTLDHNDLETMLAQEIPCALDMAALLRETDAVAYGRELTRQIVAEPDLRVALAKARAYSDGAGEPLRIRLALQPDDPELHSLRWETLMEPDSLRDAPVPFARNALTPFARALQTHNLAPVFRPSQADLRATVAVAAPLDHATFSLDPIDVEAEVQRATAAFGPSLHAVVARHAAAAVPATLTNLIAGVRRAPHVLYLVCHGRIVDDEPSLCLEDPDGRARWVSGADFVAQLTTADERPLLVILASCQSAGKGYGPALAALGPRLARAGIPAVLGFQSDVSQATVARLIPPLVEELRREGVVDKALNIARTHLGDDWWQATLWLRSHDGALWRRE